ncbi:hypothetical protein RND81_07G049200 [Saponaria officinalis]|uniref:F-box domain-containing protein n=1 Tax=Saponaria officinalis TaxID=3572 RepID=A0AAW1JN89_SAPOF
MNHQCLKLYTRMAQEGRLKRGKSVDGPPDYISELPRGVIDSIIERLPLRDAARMSFLSRKWFEIWTSIQKLAFDAHFFSSVLKNKLLDANEFSRIVSKILFHHDGHLLSFHLYIPSLKSWPDVNQWICYLSRTDVADISIQNQFKAPLKLSSRIFSCDNLEKLKLHYLIINPPYNFGGFRKLTCLELDKTSITEKAFKFLIRSCPLLQKLRLTNFIGMEHIIIDAPYMSRLIVDGTFISLDVRNAANLVSALFGLQKWVEVYHLASLRVLIQALISSCNLQKLCFRGHFSKALYKKSLLPTAFAKLKNLDLSFIHLNDVDDFSSIISTIQSCPAIEKLNISVSTSKYLTGHVLDYDPDHVLCHLCYADVILCCGSNMELKLIEFLLACSPVLKKLSVTSNGDIKRIFRPKMMVQLIRFRRASQTVEVICPEPLMSVYLDSSDADSFLSSSDDAGDSDSD